MLPEIFIGDGFIYAWEAFLHISYILTMSAIVYFRPKDFQLTRVQLLTVSILYLVFGLFGVKLLSVFLYIFENPNESLELAFKNSGMAFLGAPLAGFFIVWLYSQIKNVDFLKILDYLAPLLMIERVFGRIGCLMEGCCYGKTSNLPWGVVIQFEPDPCHPTQAYAIIAALSILIASRYIYKNFRDYKGVTISFVVLLYSGMRFINEFLRVDSVKVAGVLKVSHIAMLLLFALGAIGLHISLKNASSLKPKLYKAFQVFLISLIVSSAIILGVLAALR